MNNNLEFKDIVHTQAQWEIIEQKLRERDEFEKAKSILITRTEYKWNYNYNFNNTKLPDPIEEYTVLTNDQETAHIAYLMTKIRAKDKTIEEYKTLIADLEKYKPNSKPKRRFGFLWKIS